MVRNSVALMRPSRLNPSTTDRSTPSNLSRNARYRSNSWASSDPA